MRIPDQYKPTYVANKKAFVKGLLPVLDYNFGLPFEPPTEDAARFIFESLKRTLDLDRERTARIRAERNSNRIG